MEKWFELSIEVAPYGLTGGLTSVAGGGNFQSGFLAAGFSALAEPYIDAVANDNVSVGAAASSVVGCTASVLGGGKFENGAITGAFAYAVGKAAMDIKKSGISNEKIDWSEKNRIAENVPPYLSDQQRQELRQQATRYAEEVGSVIGGVGTAVEIVHKPLGAAIGVGGTILSSPIGSSAVGSSLGNAVADALNNSISEIQTGLGGSALQQMQQGR